MELQSLILAHLDLSSLIACYQLFPNRAVVKALNCFTSAEIVMACYPREGENLLEHIYPTPEHLIIKYNASLDEIWYGDKRRWHYVSKRALVTISLIDRYLDKWDWSELSSNAHLTPSIIEQFKDRWNWYDLSSNSCLTIDLMEKYIDYLKWCDVSKNRNLTADFVDCYHDKFDYIDWIHVSQSCRVTIELIEKHLSKWHWYWLSFNRHITPEIIEKYYYRWSDISSKGEPHWAHIVLTPACTPEIIEKYHRHLSCKMLSKSPYLSVDLIKKYPGEWDWNMIVYECYCPLTVDLIEQYAHEWDRKDNGRPLWHTLGSAKCLTPELIVKYEDKWRYDSYMSSNSCLTADVIERYSTRWDWERISYMCLNEKWQIILDHPDWPWVWT